MALPAWDRLAGRTAVITGAGSGIGRAVAQRFASEHASVLLVGRTEASLTETARAIHEQGGTVAVVVGDVADETTVDHVDALLDSQYSGRLDVLVNCAGLYESHRVVDLTPGDWDRAMATNLTGPFLFMRSATRRMSRAGGGSIISVSTVNAFVGDSDVGVAAYAASKGALNGLTRQAAVEFASRGIRVNSVVPGVVDTDMLRAWIESDVDVDSWLTANVPLGRVARPEEIANVCLFLASDDAQYLTAVHFVADGGMTAL